MAFYISDEDGPIIRAMIREFRQTRSGPPTKPVNRPFIEGEETTAPETYIARPQDATGIPAMSGTTPGSAECDVYSVVDGILEDLGFDITVYNLSDARVAQEYILAHRDKFGTWIAATIAEEEAGTGTACPAIPGVLSEDLPVETDPDNVIGYKDGCLVRIAVTTCDATTGTGTGT